MRPGKTTNGDLREEHEEDLVQIYNVHINTY